MAKNSSPEVGSGHVAVVPSFEGFRAQTGTFVDGVTKDAGSRFATGFRSNGQATGKAFADGFRSQGGDAVVKQASDAVAASAKTVSAARLKEQDAAGKVRVAEAALADVRSRYVDDSVQVVRAEERLATTQRGLVAAQDNLLTATDRLTASKLGLARASEVASQESSRIGSSFAALPGRLGTIGKDAATKFGTGFSQVLGGLVGANLITGAGFALGRGITDAVSAGIDFTKGSISIASDLNETSSAVTQVFGAAAAGITAFSSTANQKLGETRQQALLGAQTFGVFGRAAGLQDQKLTGFTTNLVSLATDLASFYNTTPDDAIEALSAGLRGESEPLRRYGILLDDTTERQKALSLGIYNGKGVLTQQQRILAANAIIFDQSGIAQGDFARTSSGLANSQRILNAEIQDTQVKLGTYLLPGFTKFVSYASTTLLPKAGELIDRLGPKLSDALASSAPGIKKLLDKVGPLADKFGDMAIESLPQVVGFFNDIADRAPAAADAAENFFKVLNSKPVNNAADLTFGQAGGTFNALFDPDFWDSMFNDKAKDRFNEKNAKGQYGVIWKWFGDWWFPFADNVDKSLGDFQKQHDKDLDNFYGSVNDFFGTLVKNDDVVFGIGEDTGGAYAKGIAQSWDDARSSGSQLSQSAYSALYGTGAFEEVGSASGTAYGAGIGSQTGPVTAQGFNLGNVAAQGAASSAASFVQAGADAAAGFVNQVQAASQFAGKAGADLGIATLVGLKHALATQSPSKKARQIGQFFTEGFGLGIEDRTARATASATNLAGKALAALPVGVPALAGAGGGSGSGFPSQVTLVDSDGSLLGRMDVKIGQYDSGRRQTGARGSRG